MAYLNQPLGIIITSVLNYDQLCHVIGENALIKNATSSYVPCDGRNISGSKLSQATGKNEVPDLRGKFIRGLNVLYSVGQPEPFRPDQNGDPQDNRVVGDYQHDELGAHTHTASSTGGFAHSQSGMGIQSNSGHEVQFIAPDIAISPAGGIETRPRNVSVYYYIKIN